MCIRDRGNIEYLNDYKGYSHHPIGCPVPPPGKISSPVIGRKYYLIKYEPKGENNKWILTKLDEIIWKGEEFTEEELLRMNNLWRVKGYYGTREFYQPDELDVQSPLPDARNVLLWKPDIVTDEKGIAEVEFFCSDTVSYTHLHRHLWPEYTNPFRSRRVSTKMFCHAQGDYLLWYT